MRPTARRLAIALLIAGFLPAAGLQAITLARVNLQDLCQNADRIFSGTVLDVKPGTVKAGGGDLPVMTYRVAVDDAFKGAFETVKGVQIAEITMVGKFNPSQVEGAHHFDAFKDLPSLEVGGSYLLFQTLPGSAGLSTTVGLGQGCFRVKGKGDKAEAINEYDNTGLFANMKVAAAPARGPVAYSFLVEQIRTVLGAE